MSSPVVAQVDSVQANQGAGTSFQYGESEPGIIKRSFRRVYEHYAENNMTATGYTESLDGNSQVTAWQLDEGWHLIPYWNPGIAMTQHDLAQMHALGEGIRIDRMGFKVVNAQMFRTDITAISGVTEISNTFLDKPWWETYVDSSHNFEGIVVPAATAIATPNTVGYPVMLSNDNMKAQEVINFATGLLPRAKWSYNRTAATPYSKMTQDQHRERSGTADSIFGTHSTLNAGSRQAIGTDGIISFGHEWVNKDGGAWYPFNLPQDTSIWTSLKDYVNGINAVFPHSRTNVLNGAASTDSVGVVRRGTNLENIKHNRWAKMDLHTLTPLPQQDVPEDCFIKIQRMHDISSPMRLAGRLLIEYYCDVSIIPSTDFYMGPHSFGGGSGATTIEGRTQQNERTNGMLRKWRVWGIPAIPVPATGGSSSTSGTVLFPAWAPIDSWVRLSGTGNVTAPPVCGFLGSFSNDNSNGLFRVPEVMLTSIVAFDGNGQIRSTDTSIYCLTEDWDGDPPDNAGQHRDAEFKNGWYRPALTSYQIYPTTTVDFVWVMEGVSTTTWMLGNPTEFSVVTNPVQISIGPPAPARNLIHFFPDPVVEKDSRAAKRRKVEEPAEEQEQDIESE